MKKIISYSLWGNYPMYCVGAIKNAELAKIIYPDWICRFYVGRSVPNETINELSKLDNTEIVHMEQDGDWTSMFWRFYPASDKDVDLLIVRDCDSRLSLREKAAVDEWILSDKKFHIMRDHPQHNTEILGGMWGVKDNFLIDMKKDIDKFVKGNFWQVDQNFLRQIIFPKIKGTALVHDEFFEEKPFPTEREGKRFVGEKINEFDEPATKDYLSIP